MDREGWQSLELRPLILILVFGTVISDQVIRIRDGRGYYVSAASPFPKVDGAATRAAKRELRVSALHTFLADGATQLDVTLTRHTDPIVEGTFRIALARS